MTTINFKVDDQKKKEIEEIAKIKGFKSVSEFIRNAIEDKLNLQKLIDEFIEKNPPIDLDKIQIPDFIPDGKYLGISRNTIVTTGDSIEQVMKILYEKFPESAAGIIRKGKKIEEFEVIFSFFSAKNTNCYPQIEIENNYYPILKFAIYLNGKEREILGLVDTGASIMLIDDKVFEEMDLKEIGVKSILTANGVMKQNIYRAPFKYEEEILELDFTHANISGPLPIQALIGKNFIDEFNLIFLGKEKLFCIQKL